MPANGNKKLELAGQVFGKLTVLKFSGKGKGDKNVWECSCSCGNICVVSTMNLRKGCTNSCGCLRGKGKPAIKHGLSGSKQYNSWFNMKTRCNYTKDKCYAEYGGRGITYESKWETFEGFWEDMGSTYIDGFTLERKDPNGNYTMTNCIWIPRGDQGRNKRISKSNNSGVTGVCYDKSGAWVANWYTEDKKQRSKRFSLKAYGDELAFFMACEYREQMINLLKLRGVYYGESHGK